MKQSCTSLFLLAAIFLYPALLRAQSYPVSPLKIPINTIVHTSSVTLFPRSLIPLYDTIRITFIGDVMQHIPQINSALINGKNPHDPKSYDFSYAFKYIEPTLQKADIAAANIEFPTGGAPYKGYPTFSAPPSIIWQAKKSGINLFLLANNHLMDMGKEGFAKTLSVYKMMEEEYAERAENKYIENPDNKYAGRPGSQHTGAYLSAEEEREQNPILFTIRGTKIAILNFTYGTNGFPVPSPYVINIMDSTHVKEVIQRAKERGAELIIAAPHWGEEYRLKPSAAQKKWAQMMFREGVKVILGSHPHVPQQAEIYYKKQSPVKEVDRMVFYSLGNYITNQSIPNYTQIELMVTVTLVKNNLSEKLAILPPDYEFMWCFKKNEFAGDYTVVPIRQLLRNEHPVKNKLQHKRMMDTYQYILEQNLVKEIY